jgi:dipeptidase E
MKILLTSTGLSHQDIERSFLSMISKPVKQLTVLFIANTSTNDAEEDYVRKSFEEILKLGIQKENIQICHSVENLQSIEQIKQDVIYVCGGNTFHLLNDIKQANFGNKIKTALHNGVIYIGVSAGSIILTPNICIATIGTADENYDKVKDYMSLSIVDFEISVHSPEIVPFELVEIYAKVSENIIYAISDQTAIEFIDGNLKIIGKQLYKIFNN